jgi:hypothetical protein
LRAHLAELGLVTNPGIANLAKLAEQALSDENALPSYARTTLAALVRQIMTLSEEVAALDRQLLAWHAASEASRALAAIPGVGITTATAIAATVTDPNQFRSGRQFAAWLGLRFPWEPLVSHLARDVVAARESDLHSHFRSGGEGNPDLSVSEGHKNKRGDPEASRLRAGGRAFCLLFPCRLRHPDKLEVHLAALKRDGVVTWYDGDMQAGDALDTEIARALRQAHLFVALLSPDYLASHYCWKLEYQRAMGRRAKGTLRVSAVVVRPCDWKATTAAGFKLLPTDGKPVSRWRSQDQALLDVTQGIRRVVQAIRKEASAQGTSAPRARAAKAGSIAGAQASAKRVPVPARKRAVRNPSKTKRR